MLTHKKRKYAEARASGLNITQSAIAAGAAEKVARQSGSRWEKDPDVIAHLERKRGTTPKPDTAKPKPVQKPIPKAEPQPKKKPKPNEEGAEQAAKRIAAKQVPIEDVVKPQPDQFDNPLDFMNHVMNDAQEDPKLRLEAAKTIASFTIPKPGDKGKKAERVEKAKEHHARGRFTSAPPPLKAVK